MRLKRHAPYAQRTWRRGLTGVLVSMLVAGGLKAPVHATPGVAPTTVVTNCTQVGVQAALNIGGLITFNCGAGAVIIPLTQVLTTNGSTTTLDGGGKITLDGQQQTKILSAPYSPNV